MKFQMHVCKYSIWLGLRDLIRANFITFSQAELEIWFELIHVLHVPA